LDVFLEQWTRPTAQPARAFDETLWFLILGAYKE
jgi:hypothetical protein